MTSDEHTDNGPPPAPMSRDDVLRVAKLARLRVSDDEAEKLRDELDAVLRFAERLNDEGLRLDDAEPLTHLSGDDATEPRWDDDEPTEPLDPDAWRANAPDVAGLFLKVPRVVSKDAAPSAPPPADAP
jgi:aspartyl-tRNA(Asn)/glutamyl-tRNA(Gln) amidotransferase subunit C